MSLVLNLPIPAATEFTRWAKLFCEELAAYNVPYPMGDEMLWQTWGLQTYSIPELVAEGLPDPRNFSRWQDWATAFLQVAN